MSQTPTDADMQHSHEPERHVGFTGTRDGGAGKILLAAYLDGMRGAATAAELEAAIQVPFAHTYRGPKWSKICAVRIQRGVEICDQHPLGRFVPRLGKRHALTVCGETYRVGYGQNSTGVRYCWHYAETFAIGVLIANGLSRRAAHRVWDCWNDYPHRCLSILDDAAARKIPDPPLGTLILAYDTGNPINYSVEKNDADKWDRRATRPCECGGTLFDWGSGFSCGFTFVSWHCCKCPRVFTEYVTKGRFREIRSMKTGTPAGSASQ